MPLKEKPPSTTSPSRHRLLFLLMVLTPFLFFVLLELLLRIINYGSDLSLFRRATIHDKPFYVMNPEVRERYFFQVDFHPATSPDFFEVPKPPGTCRIFCLGGSTTVGYPYWFNGSFSAFLRDRLRSIFPEKKIEVINLGMTATNSYSVADIVRELPAYQPDCIIVYDGHNEFYGALGVASHESIGRSRWINRLYLRLVHFRVVVLMRDLVSAVIGLLQTSEQGLTPATAMEILSRGQYVPYSSNLYREGLEVFRENLGEIRDICTDASIPLILSTQVSNLRRQHPFVSRGDLQTTPEDLLAFNTAINRGITSYLNGDFQSALIKLREIAGPETVRADLHFGIAQCLDTLSQYHEARHEYEIARDLDQLRFRASSDFNNTIRSMAEPHRIFVADVEKLFARSSPDSLIGNEFIMEHLHPNLVGQFMIAKEYARILRAYDLVANDAEWHAADTLSESRLWEERSATKLDELIGARKTAVLTSGWPFSDQPPAIPTILPTDTLGQVVELYMREKIGWNTAHMEAAAYYANREDVQEAAREYMTVAKEIPWDASPLVRLGNLYLSAGRINDARLAFERSLQREETAEAYSGLGKVHLLGGNIPDTTSGPVHR